MRVGLISDTHGYFDPRIDAAFEGVELILHAGDVGKAQVLERLSLIAPVQAVQGNNDGPLAALALPCVLDLEIAGRSVHVVHQLPHARLRQETNVVVYGHSHIARSEWRDGLLFINPGAAGRAGFHKVQTVALMEASGVGVQVRLVELGPRLKTKAEMRPRRVS